MAARIWPAERTLLISLANFLLFSGLAFGLDDPPSDGEGSVVVEGERANGPDPQKLPASVTVIQVDESLPASSDVASALDSAAGATVRSLGGLGDWSGVSIRGSSMRQVQVYLDGVPLNPDGASAINLSELPLGGLSRIEVYRSNPPPDFAASPVGGVVNLVSADVAAPPVISLAGGSYQTGRLSASGGLRREDQPRPLELSGTIDAFSTKSNFTYFDDNGTSYNLLDDALRTRANNDKHQLNGSGRLRWGSARTRLTVMDAALWRDEGLPGAGPSPAADARLRSTRDVGVAQLDHNGDKVQLRGRAYGWGRAETFDDRQGEIGVGNQWSQSTTSALGLLGHGAWLISPRLVPTLTVSARQDRYQSLDLLSGEVDGPHKREALHATLAASAWLAQDRLTLTAALQGQILDNRALGGPPDQATPLETSDSSVVRRVDPRGGALVTVLDGPTALAIKANAGRTFRPPDFTELFGDRGALVGNPELVPEQGWQADLGGRLVLPVDHWLSGSVELSAYANRTHDLITWIQTGQRVLVPINLGEAQVRGVEAASTLDLGQHLEGSGSLTRAWSQDLRVDPAYHGNQLPRVPSLELYEQLAYVWEGRAPGRVGQTLSYTAGNYWDATNWYLSAPRAILGVFARVSPLPAWTVELDVLNLSDRHVEVVPRNPLDPDDPARVVQAITDFTDYPLPGRTLLATVRWSPPPMKEQERR